MKNNTLLRVTTAAPDLESAKNLARAAVEAHLAGNAQVVGPVVSVFWHLGEMGEGEEYQVILATAADAYSRLEALLIERHPWDNPEITAVEIVLRSEEYARWLYQSTLYQD